MNTRDLEYLVALSDMRHFGRAAEACFVSQPALSMQIKKLEETLGVQLLERTNKSVILTDDGAVIVERAKAILQAVDEIKELAQSAKDPLSGEIRLGVFPTLGPYLLPLIIPSLSRFFPKLSFYLVEEQTSILMQQLKNGEIHAAFLALPVHDTMLNHAALFEEEFFLAVPEKHRLAPSNIVQVDDLHDENILLLDQGHCLRDQALDICHRMKVVENQNFRATSLETLRQMVIAGVGLTFMPKLACHAYNGIVYIPFASSKPARKVGLFWRASSAKKALMDNLVKKIHEIIPKHI